MITLGEIRAAILAEKPWSGLDVLVRAELASGRKTREIYEVLFSLWDQVALTPGVPEDGEDAFGDTLDALTGDCHPDCQYKDPPHLTMPTKPENPQFPAGVLPQGSRSNS